MGAKLSSEDILHPFIVLVVKHVRVANEWLALRQLSVRQYVLDTDVLEGFRIIRVVVGLLPVTLIILFGLLIIFVADVAQGSLMLLNLFRWF